MEINEIEANHPPDKKPVKTVEQCRHDLTEYLNRARPWSARIWALSDAIDVYEVSTKMDRVRQSVPEKQLSTDRSYIGWSRMMDGLELRKLANRAAVPGYLAAERKILEMSMELQAAVGNPEGHSGNTDDLHVLQQIRDSVLNQFPD